MHVKSAVSTVFCAAFLATSVSAQCVDKVVTGEPAFVAEAFEGLKTEPTGQSQWNIVPGTGDATKGYVAIHFNPQKCEDLSQYKGVAFDVTAPANGKFQITWNIRNPDCLQKTAAPQEYKDAAGYIKAGKVEVPFADFGPNLAAKYVEDMTLISFNPAPTAGAEWKISNIVLKCQIGSAASNTTGTAPTSTNTPTTTGNSNAKSGASNVIASAGALFAGILGTVFVI